ncbi:hypothetical protein [Cohnella candidum]|uniref:BIG2 domain-containing protein n=1 Tax=Cohnella candidum TaxID=2674991 RepID=A0A3G3K036_9BACL|nr:hypothetical protein [Cohnella candidum]AYQ73858.1 hypothetical protein EAV92_15485 [Cohnella candidum]
MQKSRTYKPRFRYFAAMLVMLLFAQGAAGIASAEDTVTGIQFDAVPSPIQLYVEDNTYSLTLWANIQGSTAKNVTSDATWSSSSSSIKVDKGVLSATGAVTSATITAKYKTFTATATVKADYYYASLKLENSVGGDAPDQLDIEMGNSLSFNASAYGDNGSKVAATGMAQWLTSNANVATVSGGNVTLIGTGTVTITAKLKGRSDSVQLNVTSPYKSLDISHKTADDAIELNVGDEDNYVLKSFVTLKNSSETQDVTDLATWTSSNGSVVKVEKGVVTPVGSGSAVVTAMRYGVSDAVTFYVRTPYEALNVKTSKPLNMTLYATPAEVSVSAAKGTAPAEDVSDKAEWKIADPMVAMIAKDNGKVTVTPKSPGSTKLTVSYKGLSKEMTVSVFPTIQKVIIPSGKLDLFEGETGNVPAVKGTTVSGDQLDITKLVRWKSSDESVLALEDGKWTAKKVGTVTLTAEVENEADYGTKSEEIEVEVHKNILTLLTDTANMSVVIGKESDLPKVRLVFTDGEEKDVTADIEWKASNANLFVKDDKMKGLLPASVTLTGTYLDKKITVKIQVEEEFASFDIQPKALSLTLNRSQSVKVTGITKSGKKVTLGSRLTWTTSSESLVQVKGSSVKGVAEGNGKLTATIQGKTLELPFSVIAKLTKLTASDSSFKMAVGQSETVSLKALYDNGKSADVTKSAVWTSSKNAVATVTNGTIKAVTKGSASIKAVYGGKTVTIRITVK